MRVILNTMGLGTKVHTIYQLDVLVQRALSAGASEIEIAEPSNAVLEQLHAKRNYELLFKISE